MFAAGFKFPKNLPKRLATLKGLPRVNKEFTQRVMRKIALRAKNRVKAHIRKQDLQWKPLSPNYLNWKKKQGLDTRIWVSTGLLYNSIDVIENRGEKIWFIGIDSGIAYPGTDISVALVALVNEFGSPSRGIPARPVFIPTRREMKREINLFIKGENTKFIRHLQNLMK